MESFFSQAFSEKNAIYSVFLLTGIAEWLVLYFIYRHRQNIIESGQETTGTVVDIISKKGPKGNTSYYPVFRFRTYMNEEITSRSMISSTRSSFRIGDEISIIYHSEKPKKFILKNDKRIRLVMYLMGGLAIAFMVFGLYGLLPLLSQNR